MLVRTWQDINKIFIATYYKLGDKMNENKIKYLLWCPICNKKALAPFPPIAVGIDLETLKDKGVQTVIYEQICAECFNNPDA
jgi:hypothetical protein